MSTAKDALAAMGISVDEAHEADERLKDRPTRDPRFCLCGHAINKHTTAAGVITCQPSRMFCPCKNIRAVVEVEDTRLFLRKTTGPGVEHALVRGISALAQVGKEAKWIEPPKCDRCSTTEGQIIPTPMNLHSKTVAYEATGVDALLCTTCREEL
jgi:hypothetical protein